jgi:peptidoglycan/LPS O-acetylase OafA/YrhL
VSKERVLTRTPHPSWRPEVQALRAVAVAAVVVFHYWPASLPGGYVGVDVFFVISGFLITSHLLRELEDTGRVKVVDFWARRIRRLLPAALTVLAVTLVATLAFARQAQWVQWLGEIAASAGYFVNWVLAGAAVDYFAQDALASPVQHYWSLSVEEQFYIVWPLIFIAASLVGRRIGRGRALPAIAVAMVAVFVISLAFSIVGSIESPQFSYFSTVVHAWEFAVGGLTALWLKTPAQAASFARTRGVAGWLGFGAIVASAFVFTEETAFPGWVALWPVAGVVLVIWAGSSQLWWSSIWFASRRSVQKIGSISYSLYLWHWPVLVFAGILLGAESPWWVPLVLVAVSIILALATTRFIEDPVRRSRILVRSRRLTYGLASAMSVVLIASSVSVAVVVAAERQSERDIAVEQTTSKIEKPLPCFGASAAWNSDYCGPIAFTENVSPSPALAADDGSDMKGNCWSTAGASRVLSCSYGSDALNAPTIVLVGDSHAGHHFSALKYLAEENGWSLVTYLKHSCAWRADTQGVLEKRESDCAEWNQKVSAELDSARPDVIVTSSYIHDLRIGELPSGERESALAQASRSFAKTWSRQIANGSHVLAIVDNPRWGSSPTLCLSDGNFSTWGDCTLKLSDAFDVVDPQIAATAAVGALLVDLTDVYCVDGMCPAIVGDVIVYRDRSHLTATFSLSLAPVLEEFISPLVEQ